MRLYLPQLHFRNLYRPENFRTKQAVLFRLESPVVGLFSGFHLSIRPFADGSGLATEIWNGFQIADIGRIARLPTCCEKIVKAHYLPSVY